MKKSLILFASLAFVFSLGLTGCKKGVEDACENLAEIAEDEDMKDMEKCKEELNEMKEECKNGDEFIDCLAGIEDKKGMLGCFAHCAE